MKKRSAISLVIALFMMPIVLFAQQNKEKTAASSNTPKEQLVLISTNFGDIQVRLYNETPLHRDNFIRLVKSGFYTDLLFHSVVKNFGITGGDPESRGSQPWDIFGNGGPGYNLPAEVKTGLYPKKGALVAAPLRGEGANAGETNGSQIMLVQGTTYSDAVLNTMETRYHVTFSEKQRQDYKTIGGNPMQDGKCTVFGEVVSGLDVIDKIASVKTNSSERPLEVIKMTISLISK